MLLSKKDLDASLYPEIASLMSRYSDTIINAVLNDADGYLTAYLGSRYNIGVELTKTDTSRNSYLLSLARDIAIYRLYALQETIPKHREVLFNSAITMLAMIRDGKGTLPGVDPAPVPDPLPAGQVGYGSNTRRTTLNNPVLPGSIQYT